MTNHTHNTAPRNIAIAMTIAGSDSSGGAGIQADLKTFSALGIYGASVITAITAQNTQAVTRVHNVPTDTVIAQIRAVLDDLEVGAIKIGMLSSPEIINAVANAISDFNGAVVLDPVMISKSGDRLLQPDAIESLKQQLLPRASLITPNLPEAATLLDTDPASNDDEAVSQGEALLKLGAKAVLMKGGHASGKVCVDHLISDGAPLRFEAQRIDTQCTHGTGCTLSSAIAARMASGDSLTQAVSAAHAYLQAAIQEAETLRVGHGHGPVHHFHDLWREKP